MNLKFFKLFLLATLAGVILRISNFAIAYTLVKCSIECSNINVIANLISVILSIAAFLLIGIKLRKEYDRKMFLKSATVLVVYYIVIFVIERIAQYNNAYSLIIYWFFIPMDMFTPITLVLSRLNITGMPFWVYAIPSLFAPYLFVLFGKKDERSKSDDLCS